ncbi:MAG: UDP-3-O-acyl-N-acetylglucosamine deacetylase, partial [Paludibacteraceae bacterium]|nr:UDP-3-O-acyl-N-acetylglucosamine deacetylase [Paludibacteraceae bacterium]
MIEKQRTIKESFTLKGKGLHSGVVTTLTFHPAPSGYGRRIKRVDLAGAPEIEALAENVVETSRGTVIAKGEAKVSTIEHAMAALYAFGVDNCLMEVDG